MEKEISTVEDKKEVVEETGEVDTQTTEKNEGQVDVKSEAQKIADSIVAKKLKGMPTKEELKAFKEWQDSQKTETEKQSEISQKLASTEMELSSTKQLVSIFEKGITDKDTVEFIQFKVAKMEGDFEDNLENFLKENPKYLQTDDTNNEEKDAKITTGVAVNKITTASDNGVSSILKTKYPQLFK